MDTKMIHPGSITIANDTSIKILRKNVHPAYLTKFDHIGNMKLARL